MKSLTCFAMFVNEINKENGQLYKQSVLEKYKDDDSVKYFLRQVFDPFLIFGISTKKLNKDVGFQAGTVWLDYPGDDEIFEYLRQHNTGTDKDIWTVQQFKKAHILADCHELFDAVITKSLSIGCDIKTINKIIPGLIPEFNVMLAEKYFENPKKIEGQKFAITTKIDGGRIIAIKENGNVTFYTRQGQVYEGLVDLENEMKEFMPDNICLDGEITLLNPEGLTSKEQYKQTMKITRADGEKHGVKMLVFDYLSAQEFRQAKCDNAYWVRRIALENLFKTHNYTYFNLLPTLYIGTDTSKITEWLNYNIAHGEEGIMLNNILAPYEFKRTWNLLKVKKMNDLDLEVIGFEEGSGRLSGTLGALLVSYKDNIVKVGSGFSDSLRDEIWNNREVWLGRTVVIQYFEETTNQNGGISLRFPVYLDYRLDK